MMQLIELVKTVEARFPTNTCHPGGNVQNKPEVNPPAWNCGVCGKTHCADKR